MISASPFTDSQARLATVSLADGILGRSVVIHDAAGARIGCCTIRLVSGIYRGSLNGLWTFPPVDLPNIVDISEIESNAALNQTAWTVSLAVSNSTIRGYPVFYYFVMTGSQNGAPTSLTLLDSAAASVANDGWSFPPYVTGSLHPFRQAVSYSVTIGYYTTDLGDWSKVDSIQAGLPDGGAGQVVNLPLRRTPQPTGDRLPVLATCQFSGLISGAINIRQEGNSTWISTAGLSVCSSPENLEWDVLDWKLTEDGSCANADAFMRSFTFPPTLVPVGTMPFGGCSGASGTACAPDASFSVGALSDKHGGLQVVNGRVQAFTYADSQIYLNGPFSVLGRSIRLSAGSQTACCTIGAVGSLPTTGSTCVQDLSASTQAICKVASTSVTGTVTFTQSNTRGSRLDWNFTNLPSSTVNVTLRDTGSAHGLCAQVGAAITPVWPLVAATGYGISGVNLDYSWSVLVGATGLSPLAGKALLFEADNGETACCTIGLVRGRYSVAPLIELTGQNYVCQIANNSEVNLTVAAESLSFGPYLGGTRMTGSQYSAASTNYTWHIHVTPVPNDGNCLGTGGHWNPFNPPLNAAGVSFGTGELSNKHGVLTSDFVIYDNDINTYDLSTRSLTVHGPGGVRVGCCDLAPGGTAAPPTATTDEVYAECVFKGAVSGAVWFHELPGAPTTEISSPGLFWCADNVARSVNITAHIHDYAHFDGASCTATGGHYGKLATGPEDFWGPDAKGLPFAAGWSNMEIGDLTGKHQLALKSGDSFVWDDAQVHLSGPFSVLGRSITVHNGTARIDCCTITRIASTPTYAGPNTCLPTFHDYLIASDLTLFADSPFADIYNTTYTDTLTGGAIVPFTAFVPTNEAIGSLFATLDAGQIACLTTTPAGALLIQELVFSHFSVGAALTSGIYNDTFGQPIDLNISIWLVNNAMLNDTVPGETRNGYVYKLNSFMLTVSLVTELHTVCPPTASAATDSNAVNGTDSAPLSVGSSGAPAGSSGATAGSGPATNPTASGTPGSSPTASSRSPPSPPGDNSNAVTLAASLLLLAFA